MSDEDRKAEAVEFVIGVLAGIGMVWRDQGFGAFVAELVGLCDAHALTEESEAAPIAADEVASINFFRQRFVAAVERLDLGETERLCGELLDKMAAVEVAPAGDRLRMLLEEMPPEGLRPLAARAVVEAVEVLHAALAEAYGQAYDLAIVAGDTVLAARARNGETEIRPCAEGSEEAAG
ncbi:hypothetical protein [Polyangium sp. 6x1]|uniref:hypothetical protein n=1 Tax=Polyangium sp. 6x1 TaxID=3042689 RepID=UPI002482CDE1|nr:hypothetical protein [Polyangium sp. 6x1]MDI1451711.1 hypothetical protein [Polyangium sp. 6x1]